MIVHQDSKISIYFGDVHGCSVNHKLPDVQKFYDLVAKQLKLDHLVVLNQVHGTDGRFIDQALSSEKRAQLFDVPGDWLVTNQKKIGIGVLTADCLPVVMYDPAHHVAAVAHAGWKGTLAEVVPTMLTQMKKQCGSQAADVHVYFGPSARTCCYEVTSEFLQHIEHLPYKNELIIKRDNKLFFDVPLCNKKQLLACGIKAENVSDKYNLCTICNHQFHSYRRAQASALRQATIVYLAD